MPYNYRDHLRLSDEIKDILIADLALALAFAIMSVGGIFGGKASGITILFLLPITLFATTLVFVLHELMHKFVAQRFGAVAAFRRSDTGIMIALITSFFGFLLALPGATYIYTNSFTKKENGYVSLAGPLTNFIIFIIFYVLNIAFFSNANIHLSNLTLTTYAALAVQTTMFISILLAFYNMLPIYPLDGSKILAWNRPVYAILIVATFVSLSIFIPLSELILLVIFMLIFSFFISSTYRNILQR